MQLICAVLITCHIDVIHSGLYGTVSKPDRVAYIGLCQPTVCLDPWICSLLLVVILKYLLEQTHMVI